ncbi:type III-B CRISPR-associated protein Cas10/Cmr2 [Persephonella sp. KM09-Lau-8]|uniref:type III-B CRISPR-associated protein Cas10/Cmr2 n=1 Tax=Persephonella sp. KM09-Lau-8 TaxID=1158345 RepID=UPI0004983554|nr:type III-B CRISPR-associated protein Cas10/Cmr2 [Persephonella sp. KM09-Lau-8]
MTAKNYIFIFTITPVQSFISQARKTRDLFAGSQILSELTKEAVGLAKKKGAEIIIPSGDLDKAHSISNKFVAIFENIKEEDLEIIGKDIEFRTLLHWKNKIAHETLRNIKGNKQSKPKNEKEFSLKFNDHITKYFNIYWLFYPIENNSYENAYKEAEKYLGAIKNVRCFEQFDTEENHRKCSICGERDAIVYREIKFKKDGGTEPAFAYKNSLLLPNNPLIESNEGLCGVCFVKRFYVKNEDSKSHITKKSSNKSAFPSTAKIAFLNVENRASDILKEKLEKYKDKDFLKQENFFNEQLYYEENLTKKYFKDQGLDESKLFEAKSKLQEIYQLAKKEKIPITRYYALIKFDGDSMGKWLSGEYLKDKSQLKDFHKALSYNLLKFAEHSRKYLDGELDGIQKGKTVYAGGDDFLGFINLKYLFEVLEYFRKAFDDLVNCSLVCYKKENKNLTFSAGIVIAHYKDPLSLVLDWVNKLEEEAKSLDEKNAFGIAVLKRSGEIRKAIYKWDKLEYIQNIYRSIVEREEFNSSFITKLEESFKKIFIDFYLYEEENLEKIKEEIELEEKQNFILVESKRVLGKSSNISDKKERKKAINSMNDQLNQLIDYENYDLQNFFGILNIIKFLEREISV